MQRGLGSTIIDQYNDAIAHNLFRLRCTQTERKRTRKWKTRLIFAETQYKQHIKFYKNPSVLLSASKHVVRTFRSDNATDLVSVVDSAMKRKHSEWTRTEKQLVVLVIVAFIVVLLLAVLLVVNFFVLRERKVRTRECVDLEAKWAPPFGNSLKQHFSAVWLSVINHSLWLGTSKISVIIYSWVHGIFNCHGNCRRYSQIPVKMWQKRPPRSDH